MHPKILGDTMQKLRIISIVFVCLVFGISCNKIENPLSSTDTGFQFPLTVGSSWKYSIIDTLVYTYTGQREIHYDTVQVTIIDDTVLYGKKATVWEYKFKNKTDTLFAQFFGDTLLFYTTDPLNKKFGFVLPLRLNAEWQLPAKDYQVVAIKDVRVPAGLFKNVFVIREFERQGNAIGYNYYFVKSNVGIITYHYRTFVPLFEVNHITKWELLSYLITN